MVGAPKPTRDDAFAYLKSVKEAFHDEPAKYREFVKRINDFRRGVDLKNVAANMEKLFKGHRNLLLGFSVFLPAWVKITIPPEAEQRVENFVSELKERFQGDDRYVYESFLEIMEMYIKNKSINELYEEVVALLEDHEDLVMEFLDIFN